VNPKRDELYRKLLHAGFVLLREASAVGDLEWITAEIELLHNVPSLINEDNRLRHDYFWFQERVAYLEWGAKAKLEAQKTLSKLRYDPLWAAMQPLFQDNQRGRNS